jgi:DNA-binding MarR family transcriptional regulator
VTTINQELELVESMDKLSTLMKKFQTELLSGDLKEYTLRQLYYIELIDKHEGISVSEISKTLDLKKSTISIAVNQLIDLEIVDKIQSNNDKRVYFLKLTPKGKNIMKLHKQVHQNTIKKILKILNPEEVENFINIVDKINVINVKDDPELD